MTGESEFTCGETSDSVTGCTMKKVESDQAYPKTHTCLCSGNNCNTANCDCSNPPELRNGAAMRSALATRGFVMACSVLALTGIYH